MAISTFGDLLANDMTLALHCWRCRRWHDVDIAAIVEAGRGDESYVGKRPICTKCGERGTMQIQPAFTMTGTG